MQGKGCVPTTTGRATLRTATRAKACLKGKGSPASVAKAAASSGGLRVHAAVAPGCRTQVACKVAYHLEAQGESDAGQGPRTLYDKIFEDHTIDTSEDGTALLFVDRHLVHEVWEFSYFPAGHEVQAVAPALEIEPLGHVMQLVDLE